ncbi:MAG: zinc ribbon domain-containing protein [SAR202 cluster bacterium]|nr:zinc ribbon domain-containing protein [SAR202 cluster bacterium]
MPRYAFRCTHCGVEFEVARPMSRAGEGAECPADGAQAERVFYMPNTNSARTNMSAPPSPASGAPVRPSGGHSHGHGHSHGPGSHTH